MSKWPNAEWLRRAAEAEDECPAVSVGGLAVELGLYMAPELTRRQIGFLQHAIGYTKSRGKEKAGFRNYFALYPDSDGFADCEAMVAAGLMKKRVPDPEIFGDLIYFHVTSSGQEIALAHDPID